jgi:ArsR family transcriptional regulator, lead/cadmium/zinc/bismuth-responsive transcriptional repressor
VAVKQGRAADQDSDALPCASCSEHEHAGGAAAIDTEACERAAAIFRALGDPQRLRILVMLEDSERCVSELCQALQDNMPAISQRLRLLKSERIVRARRDGKHIYYALADNHIARLVTNGLLHALEQSGPIAVHAGRRDNDPGTD